MTRINQAFVETMFFGVIFVALLSVLVGALPSKQSRPQVQVAVGATMASSTEAAPVEQVAARFKASVSE